MRRTAIRSSVAASLWRLRLSPGRARLIISRPVQPSWPSMSSEHVDVVIVGAGISGVGAGCRLQENCPDKSFAILEARGAIGGTWDLFRFPGIRSDSDMFTLCYPFRPWSGAQAIVDGSSILDYIRETALERRHRPEDPPSPPRRRCGVVLGRRALDPPGRAQRHRRDGPPDLHLPVHVHGLLPL